MAWQPHFLFGTPNCSYLSNQQSQTGLNHIGLVSLTDIVRYAVRMLTQNILGSTGYLREMRNPARLGGSLFCPGARAHSAHALFLPSLWLNSSFRGKFDYYSQRKFALFVLIPLFSPLLCPPPFIASGLADYDTDTAGPGHFHSTLNYSMLPGCGLEGGSTLVNSARKYNSGNIVPCASKFQMLQFETLTVTPTLTVHFP